MINSTAIPISPLKSNGKDLTVRRIQRLRMRRNIGRDILDDQFLDHSLRDENIARSGSGSLKTGSVCLDIQAYPGLASNLLPGRTQGFFLLLASYRKAY